MSLRIVVATLTATVVTVGSMPAAASEEFSFPSTGGALITAHTPSFGNQPIAQPGDASTHVAKTFVSLHGGQGGYGDYTPLPAPTPYDARFAKQSSMADAYGFRFLTHALSAASYANYAADYYRLFAPGFAVTAWTDRVSGFVEAGYGGAVDSWTAGAYYLGRVRGPRQRAESPPDLSVMPTFGPHPELADPPTFERD